MAIKHLDTNRIKNIHFIGIGGISMSGLATILLNRGYSISGSDRKASNITNNLKKSGINVFIGHSENNISHADLVVYTAAINNDNPELKKAQSLGVPIIDRATLLGEIMDSYDFGIAVSGTHGKTTTTSMISTIMLCSDLNPTIHVGGYLKKIAGSTKIGGNSFFISEACEYSDSFLSLYPNLAVVLNIDFDHTDYFRNIDHVKESFEKFLSHVPKDGFIIACIDDINVSNVIEKISCKNIIPYGVESKSATWSADNISFYQNGSTSYSLIYNGQSVSDINLNVPGIHNISNSLAAIASCYTCGCSLESIKLGLSEFTGAMKRFEYKGSIRESIRIFHDYAHHPAEIKATLCALKNFSHNKIICVFQPHTYSRTKAFLKQFVESFKDADIIIVADIFAAREPNPGNISSDIISEKICQLGGNSIYIKDFDEIADYINKTASGNDIIITLGAGDIDTAGEILLERYGQSNP